jgi:hypothetical protein
MPDARQRGLLDVVVPSGGEHSVYLVKVLKGKRFVPCFMTKGVDRQGASMPGSSLIAPRIRKISKAGLHLFGTSRLRFIGSPGSMTIKVPLISVPALTSVASS